MSNITPRLVQLPFVGTSPTIGLVPVQVSILSRMVIRAERLREAQRMNFIISLFRDARLCYGSKNKKTSKARSSPKARFLAFLTILVFQSFVQSGSAAASVIHRAVQ